MKAMALITVVKILVYAVALTVGTAIPVQPLNKRDITPQQHADFVFFAQYAATAYCNSDNSPGQLISCGTFNSCPLVEANGATTSLAFVSLVADTHGLIAIDPVRSLIVVTFRGSQSIRNWVADVTFPQVPCTPTLTGADPTCLAHSGFLTGWNEVSSTVINGVAAAKLAFPGYAVVVTGHSLGGAIATLAAAYLRQAGHPCDLYPYGSPRVGNLALASFITAQEGNEYRITHKDDPVPKLPPITFNYRHISPEYWINTKNVEVMAEDVEVCSGFANLTGCNAGTGLSNNNATAHLWYYGKILACFAGELEIPI